VYAPRTISGIGLSPLLTPLIYGVVLILILLVLPQGLGGLLAKLAARIRGPKPPTRVRDVAPAGPVVSTEERAPETVPPL
jgi:branched-chain amino acid transport system permease protein